MNIRVELFAYLSRYSPTGEEKFSMEIEPGTSLEGLLAHLGIPPEVEKAVLVNGRRAGMSARLQEGDEVFVFPPAAGG
ncbi:MAG TPA: MoaD/ThiS family protein [Thermodesulfobacteriota bacterium]|nr:MoaD/ThiS family protein [Thermodesulfobacteriota bacterium]